MNERIVADGVVEQIKGDVLTGPFSNVRLNAILKQFGKEAFGRSSACMEFEHFLQQLVNERWRAEGDHEYPLGRTCLEIGTFHGITAVVLSQFFERVLCVSVDEDPSRLFKHKIMKFLGITNVSFFDAKNNKEKSAFVNAAQFDFCYQDGDHTNDTHEDFALVKRCGRVLFHEYWPLQPPVWNLVNSLPQDEVTRAQFDCLAYWEKKRG